MRRNNRRNNAKKERIIMIASSAFVLSALTMTGIYMKSTNIDSEDDGYTLDFTALEDSAENKLQEIAQNVQTQDELGIDGILRDDLTEIQGLEDDLDYMPMEAGSGLVEIPGLTDGENLQEYAPTLDEVIPQVTEAPEPEKEATAAQPVVTQTLHFAESDGLLRPLEGETLIPYSMDGSVYFSTLDQYKYNPAMMIAAEEGTAVAACADGKVIDIFENEEIGHAIIMELGDGYQITYGQLEGINVSLNSFVDAGETIAAVAAPTKYYSVEGSNLYLKLTMEDTPVNPEPLFR